MSTQIPQRADLPAPPTPLPGPPPSAAYGPPPPGRPRWRTALFVVGIVVIALGAIAAAIGMVLSSKEEVTAEASRPPKASTPEPVVVTGTLAEARLDGEYRVRVVLSDAHGYESLKAGKHFLEGWTFRAACSEGSCDALLRGASPGGNWRMNLARNGAVYTGRGSEQLTSCFYDPVTDQLFLRVRVTEGLAVKDTWTAQRFEGTLRDSAPSARNGIWVCPSSGFTATVEGVLIR